MRPTLPYHKSSSTWRWTLWSRKKYACHCATPGELFICDGTFSDVKSRRADEVSS
jgi:hypothetical protein